MSRDIRVGDFVKLTPLIGVINNDNIYTITHIQSSQPPSQSPSQPLRREKIIHLVSLQKKDNKTLTIGSNGTEVRSNGELAGAYGIEYAKSIQEFIPARDVRELGTGLQLTGVVDVDIAILIQLDDKILTATCQVDRYTRELCNNDQLWKRKLESKFPESIPFKDDTSLSWKDFYIRISGAADRKGTENAARDGHLDVLKWKYYLRTQDIASGKKVSREFVPDYVLISVSRNGHLPVLQWLASLPEPDRAYPDSNAVMQMVGHGRIDLLEWLYSLPREHRVLPRSDMFGSAIFGGHLDTLKWLASRPEDAVLPSIEDSITAGHAGKLDMLKWMVTLPGGYNKYINIEVANAAINHEEVLDWLASLPTPRRVYPDYEGANAAVKLKRLDILKWLASLPDDKEVYPSDRDGNNPADVAAGNGDLEMLEWLASIPDHGPVSRRLIPGQKGSHDAAKSGHLDMVKYIAEKYNLYPNICIAYIDDSEDYFDMIQWLYYLPPPHQIYPDDVVAINASEKGRADILDWLTSLPPGHFKPRDFRKDDSIKEIIDDNMYELIAEDDIESLKAIMSLPEPYRTYPSPGHVGSSYMSTKMLYFLSSLPDGHAVYPDEDDADIAAESANFDAVKWMMTLPPEYRVYPDFSAIKLSRDDDREGYIEMLKWLASTDNIHRNRAIRELERNEE